MKMRTANALLLLTLLAACGRQEAAQRMALEAEMAAREAQRAARAKELEHAKLEVAELGSIKLLHRFGNIWLGSQPSAADLATLQAEGVRTVVNFRATSEPSDFDEPALIAELGMKYVHLPFGTPEEMTDDILKRARQHLAAAERPLFLHCSSSTRVGAVWTAWRALDDGLEPAAALLEGKQVGLGKPEYESKVLDYVTRKRAE